MIADWLVIPSFGFDSLFRHLFAGFYSLPYDCWLGLAWVGLASRMLHMAGPAKKETIRDQFTFMHPVVKTTVVSKAIDEIAVKEKRSGDPKEVRTYVCIDRGLNYWYLWLSLLCFQYNYCFRRIRINHDKQIPTVVRYWQL